MFAIVGFLVVIGAVVGGYLMAHGNLMVLMQPNELVIIGGAAVGTLFIANPLSTVIAIFKGALGVLGADKFSKTFYLENLKMLNDLFVAARKGGMAKLEQDVEDPHKSGVFNKYPNFLKNHHAVHFVCDTLRMAISGGVGNFELDQMMELDMEVHHHEVSEPVQALNTMADALPGLGIVAAVLGVVITMGALGGPPEEIGHHVAAALVGTFLGILMCYGFFGPLASNMAKKNESESKYYNFLRQAIIAFIKGAAPFLAIEFGRRSIPSQVRPSFQEMEKACKGAAAGGGA
ncbi:MAG: flagellar motor stator protein MotA [Acidobacteria bacterium]|nr:flagellar motor stator protein MotA [Acidobacteriota bacterium]MBI3472135.1 flagellar motor stator protein MotA [Candidatus Solibacter usitatus]